jgi:hypothetical protein
MAARCSTCRASPTACSKAVRRVRAATAALAVPATGTALIDLIARFPGSGGNVDVVFQPRRGSRLLQLRTPGPSDTVILNLSNVPASALVGSTLPANAFPLPSVTA